MSANPIRKGALVTETLTTGYGNVTGDGTAFRRTRSALPGTTTQIGWIIHFKINTTYGQTLPICGWNAGWGSLLIDATNRPRMYVRKAAGQAIGNAVCPHPIPNLVPGRWLTLYSIVDIPSAACYYYYSYAYPVYSWIYLGGIVGTFAGGPLDPTNTDQILIGTRGTTPYIPITWDTFEEYVNGTSNVLVDLRDRDTLPAGLAAEGTSTFTPRVKKDLPPVVKDHYFGDKRYWPIREGRLSFDGSTGAYVTNPTPANLNVTTTLEVDWRGSLTNWGGSQTLISKWGASGNLSWLLRVDPDGIRFYMTTDGTNYVNTPTLALPASTYPANGVRDIAVDRVTSTGVVRIWLVDIYNSWYVALTHTLAAGQPIYSSTEPIAIGGHAAGTGSPPTGYCVAASVLKDGVKIFDFNPAQDLRGVGRRASSFTTTSGHTMEVRGTGKIFPHVGVGDQLEIYNGETKVWPGGDGCVEFPGTADNVFMVPDSPAFDPSGTPSQMTIITKIAPYQWKDDGALRMIFTHKINGAGGGGVELRQQYGRFLSFVNDGTGSTGSYYTECTPFDDSFINYEAKWLSLVITGGTARWWVSEDGVNWTAFSGTQPINNIAAVDTSMYIGNNGMASNLGFNGRVYHLALYNGANANGTPGGGTVMFKLDKDSFNVQRRATTLNAGAVTIFRSGSPPTRIHPTVAGTTAKWDLAQTNDGTKWAS